MVSCFDLIVPLLSIVLSLRNKAKGSSFWIHAFILLALEAIPLRLQGKLFAASKLDSSQRSSTVLLVCYYILDRYPVCSIHSSTGFTADVDSAAYLCHSLNKIE